jgi:HPt (histidine-containing phosphotransfer) domain-containing protein
MAFESGDLEATIAAASGSDEALFLELRQAFIDSLARQIDLLQRSRCDGNWQVSAMRLKGLAASFHADTLIALAEQALDAAPGDPAIIRKLQKFLDDFAVA